MGDNLHVAIAYTGYDENKEHCLYVTAYKAWYGSQTSYRD
jgi:hypothetical protein